MHADLFDAMLAAGFSGEHIPRNPAIGRFYRFPAPGQKRGAIDGWLILKSETYATFGDWRTQEKFTWRDDERRDFTPKQRPAQKTADQKPEAAADRARWIWDNARPVTAPQDHPYLIAKGIDGHGLRIDRRGNLLVPLRASIGGPVVNVQRIDRDGRKLFTKDAAKLGCFHIIQGTGAPIFAEGYATAATVHAATGRPVVVAFDAGNLPHVAAKLAVAGSAVAADNDLHVKEGTAFRRGQATWGAGHRKAAETGLPFYMPHAAGADFNDIGTEAAAEIFAAPPISDLPAFDPWTLERVEIKGRRDTDLARALSRASDPAQAAALAYTVAARMATRAPAQMPLAAIREFVWTNLPAGMVNPATLDGITDRLERAQAYRRKAALEPVTIPADALKRHQVEKMTELPADGLPADWLEGVVIVQAPKGSGKTQLIGTPFARYAQDRGRILAICHRISLVTELANRLEIPHYQELDADLAPIAPGVATCLPSISRPDHAPLIDRAEYVFIDEIAQVLRFLSAEHQCRTRWAENSDIYEKLREIVARARCVVVADAGIDRRTVDFLEYARPGERFRIIQLPERTQNAPEAEIYTGGNATGAVVGQVLAELAAGGRVWLACEGKGKAQAIADLAAKHGFKALAVTADNKGNTAQAALLDNAEAISREYDLICASPVISSGLSIEHRGAPHFTLGAFIGGGQRVTPADAAQQMARVRYLKRFAIGLLPNNEIGQQDPDAILAAWETASQIEGTAAKADRFDRLVASIRTDETNARADFAAGLLWQLDRTGWTLRYAEAVDDGTGAATKAAQDAREMAHRRALIEARHLDDDEAAEIERRADRTEAEAVLIEAHKIRRALNVDALTDELLDFWDNGRAVRRMDRFSAAQGIVPEFDDTGRNLARRRFWKACARAYGYLFEGFDLTASDWLTGEAATRIVLRAMEQRFLLSTLGIVPAEFGRWQEDRNGNVIPMRMPGAPVKTVGRILALMGLTVKGRRVRRCPSSHGYTLGSSTPSGTPETQKGNPRVYLYSVTSDSFALMAAAVARRNERRRVERVPMLKPVLPMVGRVLADRQARGLHVGGAFERVRLGAIAEDMARRRGAA